MADVEHAGAAKRRRERRLRQWHRHERMTVAMAVAEATHHSAPRRQKTATAIREVEEQATHGGLRAQTAPPPGMRPGILPEPGPQRSDRCLRRSARNTPLLAMPSLAGGDGADDTAVAFLVRREEKRKEEEEVRKVQLAQVKAAKELRERRQEMADELVALRRNFLPSERTSSVERRIAQLVSALEASASSKPPTRKRKKRRRKRTRRSSHDPLRLPGWFCW